MYEILLREFEEGIILNCKKNLFFSDEVKQLSNRCVQDNWVISQLSKQAQAKPFFFFLNDVVL